MELQESVLLMSFDVVVALAIVILTMVAALVGIVLRRRAVTTGAQLPTMPNWVLVALLAVGGLVLLVLLAGVLFVIVP